MGGHRSVNCPLCQLSALLTVRSVNCPLYGADDLDERLVLSHA